MKKERNLEMIKVCMFAWMVSGYVEKKYD